MSEPSKRAMEINKQIRSILEEHTGHWFVSFFDPDSNSDLVDYAGGTCWLAGVEKLAKFHSSIEMEAHIFMEREEEGDDDA